VLLLPQKKGEWDKSILANVYSRTTISTTSRRSRCMTFQNRKVSPSKERWHFFRYATRSVHVNLRYLPQSMVSLTCLAYDFICIEFHTTSSLQFRIKNIAKMLHTSEHSYPTWHCTHETISMRILRYQLSNFAAHSDVKPDLSPDFSDDQMLFAILLTVYTVYNVDSTV